MTWLFGLLILLLIIIAAFIFFNVARVILTVLLVITVIALGVVLFQNYYHPEALTTDLENTTNKPTALPEAQTLNQTDCEAQGGQYGPQGLAGTIFCNLPTNDAGKTCSDDLDCEKLCIYNETTNTGTCQAYEHIFGCFTTMNGGQKGPALCID